MRLTKIVATIGPASASAEAIRRLRDAGVNVARLNMSHADLDWHAEAIRTLRSAAPELPILADIPGRKIRTGQLPADHVFRKGDTVVLTTDPRDNGSERVPINHPTLHEALQPGATVLADDGTLRFVVSEIRGRDILCRAEVDGRLKSRKGINVPQVQLGDSLLTDKDREMVHFAREHNVDYIGLSFVESEAHVDAIRKLVGGTSPRIVSKIENQGGLDHMDEVIRASDAIMIDRGDLSVETNLENIAVMQKRIIERAIRNAKPVIVATEMLHSMIHNPFPTKAEVTDISNAVFDGCSATMLSGETAVGANPAEAVLVMRRILDAAEAHVIREKSAGADREQLSIPEGVGRAIGLLSSSLPITKIVCVTLGGFAARMVAAQRPSQPILAVSNDPKAARSFNLLPGTLGVHVDVPFSRTSTDHIVRCLEVLWRRDLITEGDMILVTSVSYPVSGNRMNLIETHAVADLCRAMGWQRE